MSEFGFTGKLKRRILILSGDLMIYSEAVSEGLLFPFSMES